MSQLTIVGLGLIGGSIALGARQAGLFERVVAIDRPELRGQPDLSRFVGEFISLDENSKVERALGQARLCVLAAPVSAIEDWVTIALEHCPAVTDCGSTKRSVLAKARSHPRAEQFVPGHPMAGAPDGGLAQAGADLFRGQRWILCPSSCDAQSLSEVSRLLQGLGALEVHMGVDQHDRAVALTSHLPQLLASLLSVMATDPEVQQAIGPSFASATRVAGGPNNVWRDIFSTNSDQIADTLTCFCSELSQIAGDFRRNPADLERALRLLAAARARRPGQNER